MTRSLLLALAAVLIAELLGVFGMRQLVARRGSLGRVGEDAGAADGLVLDVVQGAEKLAVGSVHVWFVASERHHMEDVLCLAEDAVHLLQGTHGGLWEEEVDDGDDSSVAVKGLENMRPTRGNVEPHT